jgi:hypothetical protein
MQFGRPAEQRAFYVRLEPLMNELPNLRDAINQILGRNYGSDDVADRVIFALGRASATDFEEALLLAANGLGSGALRTTRVMFERLVTAKYLHANPAEASKYLDYYWVSERKLLNAMKQGFSSLPPYMSTERQNTIETEYARVKADFEVELCSECHRRGVNYNWSRLDMVSMARSVDLGNIVVQGYAIPTQESHATTHSLVSRLYYDEEADGIGFRLTTPDVATKGICGAHAILLLMLELHVRRFGLDIDLDERGEAFRKVWETAAKQKGPENASAE